MVHDDPVVALVEGPCFCISAVGGDIIPGSRHGLFAGGLRILSGLRVEINDIAPVLLDSVIQEPFAAVFVARCGGGGQEPTLLLERRRRVGEGMREQLVVRNTGTEATYCEVVVRVEADLVRTETLLGDLPPRAQPVEVIEIPGGVELSVSRSGRASGARVTTTAPVRVEHNRLRFEGIVAPRGTFVVDLEVSVLLAGEEVSPPSAGGVDPAAERIARWRSVMPVIETGGRSLNQALECSAHDLGVLRVLDPEVPERAVVAAGAPWSMELHGRDALLTGWMSLLVDPELALGVLETLARFQGREVDPRTEEEPGRIPHLLSLGLGSGSAGSFGRLRSYGSVDATPLFVMLLGELRRWGLVPESVERLLTHADAALAWMTDFGDRDGDGFIEYQRPTDRGRLHQGWRDSHDAIRFADGTLARGPIALAEVQAYAYAAYVARSHFATEAGDVEGAAAWRAKADDLRAAFNAEFWLPEQGFLAMGLDRDKRAIDAPCSTAGHCLWTGILEEDRAAAVVTRLMSEDLFGGWGIRTLGSSAHGWNPVSYQNGSVWAHDNAIIAAGVMRYGYVAEAHRIMRAVLDAADAFGGRLPELYGGFSRGDVGFPTRSPASCSPQAWAAAAPLLFLRTLLRFDPWIPAGIVRVAPALPADVSYVRIEGVPLLSARLTIEADMHAVKVEGLPPGVELLTEPRAPLGGPGAIGP